jgi:DNA-binding transcriptional LysR family regulator
VPRVELRHFRYFVAVAEERHFTRAATRLGIAQPPLSQQIRQLESELGVVLFDRSRSGVRLTEAGAVFLDRARRVLEAADDARTSAQGAGRGEVGRLVVGFGGSIAIDVLADAVRAHRERFPEVQLVLRELVSADQISGLVDRQIQVGLLWERTVDARLQLEVLRSEPLVAALPTGHRLASRQNLAVKDLAAEPFVLSPTGQSSSFTEVVLGACARAGFSPNVVQEASEAVTVLGLVAAGIGISLLPVSVTDVQAKGVVYHPLRTRTATIQLAMAWLREGASPLVHAFLDTCRSTVVAGARDPS